MKLFSKILLIAFGALAIAAVLLTIMNTIFNMAWFGFGTVFTIVFIVLSESGVISQDSSFFIIQFIYGLSGFFGATSPEAVYGLLIAAIVVDGVYMFFITIYNIIPIIIGFVAGILALISGMKKKQSAGLKIANIITGVFCWNVANAIIGIGIILGGVFGLISLKKEENKAEEERKAKEQPYQLVGVVDIG